MNLGLFTRDKCKKCKICNRIVVNKRHSFCSKCCNKKQEKKDRNEQTESIKSFFLPKANSAMKNVRHVDPVKYDKNIRLLSLSLRGFGPDATKKIAMLKLSEERLQFHGLFFSSPDKNWNSRRIELIRRKMRDIGRNIKINALDTQIDTNTRNRYLLGGTLSIVWDNLADLTVKNRSADKLGQ